MPENISPSGDRTVVVTPNRFGLLTVISLCFNGLILLLILLGMVVHHHRRQSDWRDRGEFGGERGGWHRSSDDDGMRFHHHDFGGMCHDGRGDFRGNCEDSHRGGDMGPGDDQGPGDGHFHDGPGEPGGPGFGGVGFGMPGVMGHMQPPTATGLADHIMQHLDQQLALTDQENTQIRPVIEQQVADLQKGMEARREALQKSVEDTTAKIRPLLDADQQKKLDAIKAAVESKMSPAKPEADNSK